MQYLPDDAYCNGETLHTINEEAWYASLLTSFIYINIYNGIAKTKLITNLSHHWHYKLQGLKINSELYIFFGLEVYGVLIERKLRRHI